MSSVGSRCSVQADLECSGQPVPVPQHSHSKVLFTPCLKVPLELCCKSPLGAGRASKGPGASSSMSWTTSVLPACLQSRGTPGLLGSLHQVHIFFVLRSQRCMQLCRWGVTAQRGRVPFHDLLPTLLGSISAQSWFVGSQCTWPSYIQCFIHHATQLS